MGWGGKILKFPTFFFFCVCSEFQHVSFELGLKEKKEIYMKLEGSLKIKKKKVSKLPRKLKEILFGFASFVPLLPFPKALLILESPSTRNQGYKTWWEAFQSNLTRLDCVLNYAVSSACIHALGLQVETYRNQEGSCRYIPACDQRFARNTELVISTEVSITEENRAEDK